MVNNIKQGYVNPLTMVKANRQTDHFNLGARDAQEKKKRALENEKQAVQNSLLLMKGTSGNGETSKEAVKLLEKKLEEIDSEIKTSRQETVERVQNAEEGGKYAESVPRKDTAVLSPEGKSFGRLQNSVRGSEERKMYETEETTEMPKDL